LGELRRNRLPDNDSADKLVDAVKILFQDAGSTPAASTSGDLKFSCLHTHSCSDAQNYAERASSHAGSGDAHHQVETFFSRVLAAFWLRLADKPLPLLKPLWQLWPPLRYQVQRSRQLTMLPA
jgi:hypothetical protein